MAPLETPTSERHIGNSSPVLMRKLGHVVLQVRDLVRSMKFYTEVLNFRVSDRAPVAW